MQIGKQSSKPFGVRPPSGNRPASGVSSNKVRDPQNSHYQGGLASAKFFDGPKDFNKVSSIAIKKEAKRNVQEQMYGYEELFNQSSSSFHSQKAIDSEQQKKLQKNAQAPFRVGKQNSSSRRQIENMDENQEEDKDDASRREIMKMLANRERDQEELELESCFSELKQKIVGNDVDNEIESVAGQSFSDLKEMQQASLQGTPQQKQRNGTHQQSSSIYKPAMPAVRSGSQMSTPKMLNKDRRSTHGSAKGVRPGQEQSTKNMGIDWKQQQKIQRSMSKPNVGQKGSENPGSSRLDAIYAQLKNLQNFKDEIMCDLEDFMEDVDTKSQQQMIAMPNQFDEVVDIVVADSRAKAAEKVRRDEVRESQTPRMNSQNDDQQVPQPSYEGMIENLGLQENEEKPFWTKFLRSDYLQEDEPLLPKVMEVLDGNKGVDEVFNAGSQALELYKARDEDEVQSMGTPMRDKTDLLEESKVEKEWAKIRRLEQRLGAANKAQADMVEKMNDHKMKMEAVLNRAADMEEVKKQATAQYDLKRKRGLTSQINQTEKKAQKPPVQSGKAIFKSKAQMAAEAEAKLFGGGPPGQENGDTFLTDLVKPKQDSKRPPASAMKPKTQRGNDSASVLADSEMNADDIEDELRDVVFDYEHSQAMVLAADNFLQNKPTYTGEETKSVGGGSNMSNASNLSKIQQNKIAAGKHDPFKIKLLQDKLDEKGKARLAQLLKEIDDNIDELMKEKEEYFKQGTKSTAGGYMDTKSQMSRVTGVSRVTDSSNAYLYTGQDQERVQKINEQLRDYNPTLGAAINSTSYDQEASMIHKGRQDPGNQKFDDKKSTMSFQSNISGVSRSGLSMIDMGSITSGMTGKSGKMPGQKGLRDAAERRLEKAQMYKIEAHLKKLQDTDDLSYSDPNQSSTQIGEQSEASTSRRVIDQATLAQLIDECKEEQESRTSRLGSAQNSETASNATSMQVMAQTELGQMQLARVERSATNIQEAQKLLDEIKERTKASVHFNAQDTSNKDLMIQATEISELLEKEMLDEENKYQKNKEDAQQQKDKLREIQDMVLSIENTAVDSERKLEIIRDQVNREQQMLENSENFQNSESTIDMNKNLSTLQKQDDDQANEMLRKIQEDYLRYEELNKEATAQQDEDLKRMLKNIEMENEKTAALFKQNQNESPQENPNEPSEELKQIPQEDEENKSYSNQGFLIEMDETWGEDKVQQIDNALSKFDELEKRLKELNALSSSQPPQQQENVEQPNLNDSLEEND